MDYFLVALVAVNVGLVLGMIFKTWLNRKRSVSGTIFIAKQADGKIVHTLEVEDPEDLPYRDEVIFKVETSEDT